MDKVLVSKILFLDMDYRPCGTRVIRRPGITSHNDRTDSKKIMAVGMGAFDDGDFDHVPYYWVPFDGDLDKGELHLQFPTIPATDFVSNSMNPIEWIVRKYFNFIAYQDMEKKIGKIRYLLDFKDPDRPGALKANFNPDSYVNVATISLIGQMDDFTMTDLMCSLRFNLSEYTEAIEVNREEISKCRKQMAFITDTGMLTKNSICAHHVNIGGDPVEYDQFHKLIMAPAYNCMAGKIHDLKKRMQILERKRSYIYMLMNHIMACTWYTN